MTAGTDPAQGEWPRRVTLLEASNHLADENDDESDGADIRAFAAALAERLGVGLSAAGPADRSDPTGLVLCPWSLAADWLGPARPVQATSCVVLGGEEESLIERAERWRPAAGVGSAALSWWRRPVSFSYPVLIGDVRIGRRSARSW